MHAMRRHLLLEGKQQMVVALTTIVSVILQCIMHAFTCTRFMTHYACFIAIWLAPGFGPWLAPDNHATSNG